MEKYKIMKILSQFLFVIIIFILGFLALVKFNIITFDSNELPLAIVLNHNEIGIKLGKNYQLEASIFPKDTYYDEVKWSSSDPSIVSVNEKTGYLETHKEGTVIIKANVLLNNLESECIVNVSKNDVLVKNVNLTNEEINLLQGDSFKLGYNLFPKNATTHKFDFISSDNSIAVVNENGVIKAINSGTAIITVKSRINNVSDSIVVNVYNDSNNEKEKELLLSNAFVELGIGIKSKLMSFVPLVNAKENINWFSTNNNVVMVSHDGSIVGVNEGTAKIIATSLDGKTSICDVVVKKDNKKEQNIEILDKEIVLNVGMSKSINYSLFLSNTISSIKWSSSNDKVAIVKDGIVTAKSEGEAIISVNTSNGKYYDNIKVKVNKTNNDLKIEDIIFVNTLYNAKINDTINLIPNIVPVDANNYFIEWETSDKNIATVSNGVVKCLKEGKVTITAKVFDVTSSVEIIIGNVYPSMITIEEEDYLNLSVNESRYLSKKIVPSNSTNQSVTWLSSNNSIVSVNEDGLIKGLRKGNAVITVKTINDKSYSINVKVS